MQKKIFTENLLKWHQLVDRPLPWKGETDPYLIWLSEIILQQTRVDQGLEYFNRFKHQYPTVFHLANASEDEVLKNWQGLGYYTRARNLHHTAKTIVEDHGGVFPASYQGLLKLKGIGAYTAAAIASFAFGLPHAVVDGNVIRVLSRYFGIQTPVDSPKGKKLVAELADEVLDRTSPGSYNQAIMDFGALHCTPSNPRCDGCLLAAGCEARKKHMVKELPVKSKKIARKRRFFHYIILKSGQSTYISKRQGKDIWKGLYEFPLIETGKQGVLSKKAILEATSAFMDIKAESVASHQTLNPFKQTLTHQEISACFHEILLISEPVQLSGHLMRVQCNNLHKFAFPKVIDCYLKENPLHLKIS